MHSKLWAWINSTLLNMITDSITTLDAYNSVQWSLQTHHRRSMGPLSRYFKFESYLVEAVEKHISEAMNTVRDIFNEVQRSAQTHKLCIKKLAAAINARGPQEQENITYFLNGGIDRILLHTGTGAVMDRSILFLGTFLATVDESVLLTTMSHICGRLQSSNKLVRQRVCQISCCALASLCEAKIELTEDLFHELSKSMTGRLKDKVPAVRVWALKALKYLQFPEEGEDECTIEIKRCMRCDTASTVRVAAVETLALTDDSKHDLCARLKDVKSEVRVAVLNRLAAETDMRQFTVQMRAEILRSALEDREEVVRSAVLGLIWKWLALVDSSNVLKFLNLLNPSENEDAALLVGATIMEELVKSEAVQHAKLKKALKDCYFKWNTLASNGTASGLTPSDVLWVQIRCSYARQFLPVFPASEMCEALLPDAAVLCTLLKDVKATLVNPSEHHTKQSSVSKAQSVVKHLTNLAPLLIGATDVSGLSQMMEECADTFLNTSVTLPWEAVEAALRAYAELYTASAVDGASSAHRAVLDMAGKLRDQLAVLAEAESDSEEVSQRVILSITERCLQLTHWSLQQEVSYVACITGSTEDEESVRTADESVSAVLPFVLESLQKPQYQLRYLAVGCLGLVCLLDAKLCDSYRGLILQVASGDFEDWSIRSQALQALVDFSAIFRGKYVDDNDLGNVLLRMQESGEPEAMLIAAEAAAKLLHAGTHHEPRLFANLLKFFFLTESLPDASSPSGKLTPSTGNEEEDLAAAQEEYEHRLFLANCARLQQILSIFFHVFTTTDVIADQVVAEAIPYLVADMTNEIKDGTVDASSITKILKHLLSLCENKTASSPSLPTAAPEANAEDEADTASVAVDTETTTAIAAEGAVPDSMLCLARAATAAALSKELLKLGHSKAEKLIDKEYIKLLSTLCFESWIAHYDVAAVERVVDTITLCSARDRTTAKHLEQLMDVCTSPSLHTPYATRSTVAFAELAPGLPDLIELAARSSVLDMSVDEGAASLCHDDLSVLGGMDSVPGSAVKPKRVSRQPLSATKRPTAAASITSTTSRTRLSTRGSAAKSRPSYAEKEESESEDSESSESDGSSSSSEEEDDSAAESDLERASADEEETGDNNTVETESVRNDTMSPTKNFILTTNGKSSKVRTTTGSSRTARTSSKKLDADFALSGGEKANSKSRSATKITTGDENSVPN